MIKNTIKKILVPLDGSKNSFRGLDEAIIIARNCQAIITGAYVTPLSPPASAEQKTYIKNYLLNLHYILIQSLIFILKKTSVLFLSVF